MGLIAEFEHLAASKLKSGGERQNLRYSNNDTKYSQGKLEFALREVFSYQLSV